MAEAAPAQGPDLAAGVAEADLAEGAMLAGRVGEEAVLIARVGGEVFAVGATCTHYGGPLAEGILRGETVRCPWHHACFSLRTGEALDAPALAPVACRRVERRDGKIFVGDAAAEPPRKRPTAKPGPIVVIGGGAAGFAAAEMLRREGFDGPLAMVSADADAPYDRPNLSKDYLAGTAPEEWIPLRPDDWYGENGIDLRLGAEASSIDLEHRRVSLRSGEDLPFDKLLLATGAEPVRLNVPGADLAHVHTLRSLADSRALIGRAKDAKRVAVIGASFIGLEVAASLRHRELDVAVIAPEAVPMEKVLGRPLGEFVRSLHEEKGVWFRLGRTVGMIEPERVVLDDGTALHADLVVVGVGVRPRLRLAEEAGLEIDRGLVVNEHLQTSAEGVFAAGDIARWPDPYSGQPLRIEHWVVAERQGQAAARNMLGAGERFAHAPFFWSQHYDIAIDYVGHAQEWDELVQDGDPAAHDVAVRYRKGGRTLAVASIFRGQESLRAEQAMEEGRSP